MKRSIRGATAAMAAALVAGSLLTVPVLAAKPGTGGGGGGGTTTTTTFSGSFTATPANTIVVGAITKVTFKYTWANGANRTFRLAVPTSYAKPYTGEPVYNPDTGVGAGFIDWSPAGSTCGAVGLSVSSYTVAVTTSECSAGTLIFDYYAQTGSTGSAKFPLFVDTATTTASTAFTTITLNSQTVKVAVTSVTRGGTAITAANAGDVVRVTFSVTDTKNRGVGGVPLTITDTARSDFSAGSIACPHDGTAIVVCSATTGTAWVELLVKGAGTHQVRGAVGNTFARRSFTVAAGPIATFALEGATTGDLALGETRLLTATVTDAYDNVLPLTTSDVDFTDDATDGAVDFTNGTANADGSVSITAVGAVAGDVVVTATYAADSSLAESTAFTVVTGAITTLTLSGDTADLAAGQSRTVELTAENAFGAQLALTTGDVEWTTGTADTGTVTFDPAADVAEAGLAVTLTVTGDLAGDVTIVADAAELQESTGFTVVPGAATALTLTSSDSGDLTAGSERTFSVSAVDAHGNDIDLSAADVDWTTGAGEEASVSLAADAATDGDVSVVVTGELTGGVTLTVLVDATSASTGFTVVVGALASLDLTAGFTALAPGETGTATVRGYDAKGNPVALTAADVDWTTGAGEDAFATIDGETDAAGDGTVSITVTAVADGPVTLTVLDVALPERDDVLLFSVATIS